MLAAATKLLDDAVVRDGLADKRKHVRGCISGRAFLRRGIYDGVPERKYYACAREWVYTTAIGEQQ
jgi:hypothetical protein